MAAFKCFIFPSIFIIFPTLIFNGMNKSFILSEGQEINSPRDGSLIKLLSECVTSFF